MLKNGIFLEKKSQKRGPFKSLENIPSLTPQMKIMYYGSKKFRKLMPMHRDLALFISSSSFRVTSPWTGFKLSEIYGDNRSAFRKLFHRSKGRICLSYYGDVVAIHLASTDMQFYSYLSNSVALGTPESYFWLLAKNWPLILPVHLKYH